MSMRRSLALSICFLISSLATGAPRPAAGTAPAAPLPVEYFTHYETFSNAKISPSGQYIAYLTGDYGRTMLVVSRLKDLKAVGGVRCSMTYEIYDIDWVSPKRLIYRVGQRWPGMAVPTATGEIAAVNIDGSHHKLIYGFRAGAGQSGANPHPRKASYASADLVSTLKKDDRHILIAEHPWLHRTDGYYYDPDAKPTVYQLDVLTGRKATAESVPLADATVLVDRDDNVRFAVGQNDKFKVAVSWKPTPDSEWKAFELPGFRKESIVPRLFGEDNKSILFTGVREGETYAALYRLDLESTKVSKVFAFDNADVNHLIRDFSGTRAIGVVGYTDKPIYHWLKKDDRAAITYAALLRAFPGQQVSITSHSEDGRLAIVFVNSDVNPGDYYLFDTQTMKARYLQSRKRWIDPAKMRRKTAFTMKARDGVELHGYVTRPKGDGPFPLVVLPHGGPYDIRDTWDFDWETQLLASRGYAVLQVNFRGSGGYGMDFEAAGYRQWGARMQDDITDATRWAIEQKIAQPDRICIYGASYGGYAALMGVVREPKLYRCAIGYAGVYDLELMLKTADIPLSKSGRAYLKKALGNDHEEMRSRSPVYNADKIQVPILLIHGKEDWRADYRQAKRMKAALESHHKKFEWMALKGEGHGVYNEKTLPEVYERILQFLEHNDGPRKAAPAE